MNETSTREVSGKSTRTDPRHGTRANQSLVTFGSMLIISLAAWAPSPARAADGCTVLLCLAAPSWRSIPQCVSPVREALRNLARGQPFPTCAMSGAGNSASHSWSFAPTFCPAQYTRVYDGPHGPVHTCDFDGAISVTVNGSPFSRTWWSIGGDAVTEFSPAAKVQLGSWDTRFDDELAAWIAAQPAAVATLN